MILLFFVLFGCGFRVESCQCHWNVLQVITSVMASQTLSFTIVYSTVYSGADQRKHQSPASLAFVRGIPRWPVNPPHIGLVTRKMFPFDDVIMVVHLKKYHANFHPFFSLIQVELPAFFQVYSNGTWAILMFLYSPYKELIKQWPPTRNFDNIYINALGTPYRFHRFNLAIFQLWMKTSEKSRFFNMACHPWATVCNFLLEKMLICQHICQYILATFY